MSDFSLTSLFISAKAGSVPTTGSTQNLTSGQIGIFLPDNTVATTSNVGNAKYIYFAQGRNISSPFEGSRKSDFKGLVIIDDAGAAYSTPLHINSKLSSVFLESR